MKKLPIRLAALAVALMLAATGCSLDSSNQSSGNVVNVVIGDRKSVV